MNFGNTLTVVIPLVILGYALWLVVRIVRDRKKGKCPLGGCAGCPLRDTCATVAEMARKEEQKSGDEQNEQ